jgi:hypothetical protein
LQKASAQLQTLTINGKTGSKVLADFAAMLLRQNDLTKEGGVAYRDGRRYSLTNFCAPSDSMTPPEKCACPAGATDEGDNCKIGDRIFPRGKVLGASPLYLLIDALNGIDEMWEDDKERQAAWLEARSELVDRFLAAEPVAGQDLTFRFKNQPTRKIAVKALELTKDIVELHEGSDPSAISRVLKNMVLANDEGESPLEVFFDSIAEINRDDPSVDSDFPMAPSDASDSLNRAQEFLSDGDRGLERIYKVIQSRNLKPENSN